MKKSNDLQKLENFVIFQTETGKVNVEVYFQNDTLWLSQKAMAQMFEQGRSTISELLQHIFSEGKLQEEVVYRDFQHTTPYH